MITKKIQIEGMPQYNRAEVKALLADGSARVELFHVDESGQEDSDRETGVSFSAPLPFELTPEELAELNPEPTAAE